LKLAVEWAASAGCVVGGDVIAWLADSDVDVEHGLVRRTLEARAAVRDATIGR
jgi:hypothetical protein